MTPVTADERTIVAYLATWPTAQLMALATETREGRLSYWGCNCMLGLRYTPTTHKVDHTKFCGDNHVEKARRDVGAKEAERAYLRLGLWYGKPGDLFGDAERNHRLLPFIEAELQRRDIGVKVDFTTHVVTKVR